MIRRCEEKEFTLPGIEADGPIYFAGDTVSQIPGWQEGAALSAHRAVSTISERVSSSRIVR